jgi:hypothetical protein
LKEFFNFDKKIEKLGDKRRERRKAGKTEGENDWNDITSALFKNLILNCLDLPKNLFDDLVKGEKLVDPEGLSAGSTKLFWGCAASWRQSAVKAAV